MEQDFRIRMTAKAVAQALQLPAQLRGIIQLSVIYDAVLPVSGRKDHGLGPSLQIDDGEPAVEQSAPFSPVAEDIVTNNLDKFCTRCWLFPVTATVVLLLSLYDKFDALKLGFAFTIVNVLSIVE